MGKTLKEIAKIAGTSVATVSKVVNGKTSDIGERTILHVRDILDREGYQPNQIARTLKTNQTKTLGLLIPDIRNPFFTEIARGAEDAANKRGYTVFLCNTDDSFEKEKVYLTELNSRQIDGIIVAGAYQRNKDEETAFVVKAPIVAIDRLVDYPGKISFITTDNFASSYKITEMLIELGHVSMLYVGGPSQSDVTQDRYLGFEAALNDAELGVYDTRFGRYALESGYEFIMKYHDLDKITAIVCGNDLIALGVINALKEKGISVPSQISVTGFDNIEMSKAISPSLSTVNQPTYEMGMIAVEILLKHLRGEHVEPVVTLVQEVVTRDSTDELNQRK